MNLKALTIGLSHLSHLRIGCEELDAATVLQPEPDVSGQSRKTVGQETPRTAYTCGKSRQSSTYPESFDRTYKEGVAGSNPASPTTFSLQTTVFCM